MACHLRPILMTNLAYLHTSDQPQRVCKYHKTKKRERLGVWLHSGIYFNSQLSTIRINLIRESPNFVLLLPQYVPLSFTQRDCVNPVCP